MARIRSIKPTLWASEKLGRMSVLARLNFVGLISMADDEGRGRGEKRFLLGQLHPYAETLNEQDFVNSLEELQIERLAAFYTVDRARYYALPGWRDHQYIEKWRRSELPPVPKDHPMALLFVPRKGGEKKGNDSPPPIPGNGMEGNGLEGITTAPSAVDLDEVRLPKWSKEYPGVAVANIPPEYCKWALDNVPRLSGTVKAALQSRIEAKKEECQR